ncbi:hypothetical protein HED55_25245 [Ochrobactrum haematophilum]|uniref:Uncharacterized protein n=1 Tax=Brucella haematophila TaxID=419474 RepID=A0ABX1DQR3_9HYPH|nr:hypothetical protein [Brucella haematophila]
MTMFKDIDGLLSQMGRLLVRFWPQLLLIGAVGFVARDLLMNAAVATGLRFPLGGMVILSLVVLVKLLVFVTMFAVLRPGLPALVGLRESASKGASPRKDDKRGDRMLMVTAAAILPFFCLLCRLGFLGDTVREYSRLALDRVALGRKIQIFDLVRSRSLIAAIVLCWIIRWAAKKGADKTQSPWLRLLIVAADASWIFIGLYALDKWKDDFIAWLGAGSFLEYLEAQALWFSIEAYAAAPDFVPVEFRQPGFIEQAQALFFYALLPFVWLVMTSIIYGYDLSAKRAIIPPLPSRVTTLRGWLRDFIAHYLGGYRSRYRPVWTCLRLVFGAGLGTLLSFIVFYKVISWGGAWIWFGTTHILGPYDIETWQRISDILVILIGSPSELDGGIVLDAVRVALLAAVLEYSVAGGLSSVTSKPGSAAARPA